ncbi:MAG TPA: YdcF family protein [Trinickia sp.]|nr:YdcF family protein [Trinickia sp.]
MIIFCLFTLFFAIFMLCRRARLVIAVSAAALLWLLAAGWLAAPLLDWAQSGAPDTPRVQFAPRTVIVMLGTGTEYDDRGVLVPKPDASARIVKTAALYAACKRSTPNATCTVIVSGGNPQRHEASEADTYAPYLLHLRVARADLLLDNTSLTTYENAEHVTRILHDQRYGSLILVTSAYHMPRAMLDFARFGLAPQPVIANTRKIKTGVLPRLSNLVNANIALHELIGRAQFHVYRALGWF